MSEVIGFIIIAGIYFIPTFVAAGRANHAGAIFALNFFLGWTVIGWVVALVMALWSDNSKGTDPGVLPDRADENWVQRQLHQSRRVQAQRDAEMPPPTQ